MKPTVITDIITSFITDKSDKKQSKQIIDGIKNYCTNIVTGSAQYLADGTLPKIETEGWPKWAVNAVGLISDAINDLPEKTEAAMAGFLNHIIETLKPMSESLEKALQVEADAPVNVPSLGALNTRLSQATQIINVIPNTAHENIAVLKKVLGEVVTITKTMGEEIAALNKK